MNKPYAEIPLEINHANPTQIGVAKVSQEGEIEISIEPGYFGRAVFEFVQMGGILGLILVPHLVPAMPKEN